MNARVDTLPRCEVVEAPARATGFAQIESDRGRDDWNPDDFAREQIRALVRLVFFARGRAVRRVVFSAAEPHLSVASIYDRGLLRERWPVEKLSVWGLEAGHYILYLGRFSPEKGCHLLVEAYDRLDTDTKLIMAGASSYSDEYSRELRTHAGEQIKILGWVAGEALDTLLTNAMVFVLPSDLEGLSLALLDAMGAGLCVLTSDVPENREAVEDAGFTFRRGDVDDLTDRLRFLIANPAVREAAGDAAKRRIRDHYQWRMIATEVEQVYFDAMGWDSKEAAPKKPSGRVLETDKNSQRMAG